MIAVHRRRDSPRPARGVAQVCTAAGLACLLLATSVVDAAAQVTWIMVTEYPASNISGTGLTTFARNVAARTGGAVSIRTALDNELKITSGEIPRATREGRISGGDAFAGPLESVDPIFGLPSLPFLVQSAEAAKLVNARARPLYEKALDALGMKLLYITIWPSTGLWTVKALSDPDAIRALSVRTYDNNSAEVLRTAGARADYLPFNEAIAKVKTGELNAILTSGDGGAGRKLWDELHHFTSINYAIPVSLAIVQADAFAALPQTQRDQVLAAAADTEASQFALLANRTTENYARMRKNGVVIEEPAPAPVLAALKQGATATIQRWKRKVSAEAASIVDGVPPQ